MKASKKLPPTRKLSDYKQQYIPEEVIKTFNPKKVQHYKDFEKRPIINFKKYNDYEQIISYIYELHRIYPKLVKIIKIGTTYEKRPLLVLRISPPGGLLHDRIFIEGGIHANERISPNSVLYFMSNLLLKWDSLPFYMRNKTWLILPLSNPDGYAYTFNSKENRQWRKNKSQTKDAQCPGVDLYRNFNTGWDSFESKYPCKIFYKGEKPFSEKETQAIRDFLQPQKKYLKAYVSVHNFGQVIRYLWIYSAPIDGKDRVTQVAKDGKYNIEHKNFENKIKKIKKGCKYKVQTDHKITTDKLFGLSRDWARKELDIQYSYTLELRDKGKDGLMLKPKLIKRCGNDIYGFMSAIAKGVSDDHQTLKDHYFMTQDFNWLLREESNLFARRIHVQEN